MSPKVLVRQVSRVLNLKYEQVDFQLFNRWFETETLVVKIFFVHLLGTIRLSDKYCKLVILRRSGSGGGERGVIQFRTVR